MNLRQMAEVSAIVATSGAHIIENPRPVPLASLHGYWKQSRTRLKCWFAGLRSVSPLSTGRRPNQAREMQLISLSREILVSEMLTRVWSTVLTAADQRHQTTHAEATASNTYQGHLEARNEVLRLIVDNDMFPADQQASLERLRRRTERWTDALIGPLIAEYGVGDYAFDFARAHEFSASALQQTLSGTAKAYVPLLVAGVTSAFPTESDADRERILLNRAIVRSVLSAFPKDSFPNREWGIGTRLDQESLQGDHQEATASSSRRVNGGAATRSSDGRLSFLEIRRQKPRGRSSSD